MLTILIINVYIMFNPQSEWILHKTDQTNQTCSLNRRKLQSHNFRYENCWHCKRPGSRKFCNDDESGSELCIWSGECSSLLIVGAYTLKQMWITAHSYFKLFHGWKPAANISFNNSSVWPRIIKTNVHWSRDQTKNNKSASNAKLLETF